MRSTLLILLALGSLSGMVGLVMLRGVDGWTEPSVSRITPPPSSWPDHLAANGIVEGARPEVALRPEVSGILETISIRENQDVTRGTLVAELRNEIQKQEVDLAAAEVKIAQAQLKRLRNGERPEKRRAMAAVEQAKHVVYQQAKADWERTFKLVESRSSSREQGDRDHFAMLRAQAEWDEAAAEQALVEAPARADEVAAAEGRVAVAEARLRLVKAELAKTRLLAPTDGPDPPRLCRARRDRRAEHGSARPAAGRPLEAPRAGLHRRARRGPRAGRATRRRDVGGPAGEGIPRHRVPDPAPHGPARTANRRRRRISRHLLPRGAHRPRRRG